MVLLEIEVFWNVTPCKQLPTFRIVVRSSSESSSPIIVLLLEPEDEGNAILRTVGNFTSRRSVTIYKRTGTLRFPSFQLGRAGQYVGFWSFATWGVFSKN